MPSENKREREDDDNNSNQNNQETSTLPPSEQPFTTSKMASKKNKRLQSSSSSSSSLIVSSAHYHVSLMHAETVTAVCTSLKHGYVLTASSEGVVKFWKRLKVTRSSATTTSSSDASTFSMNKRLQQQQQQQQYPCLEFVKSFTSHAGAVLALALDPSGDVACSIGTDNLLKFYDIATFDVLTMIPSPYPLGGSLCAIGGGGGTRRAPSSSSSSSASSSLSTHWAVSAADSGSIYIFSPENTSTTTTTTATLTMHGSSLITCLVPVPGRECVVSTDVKGIIEVWSTATTASNDLSLGQPCNLVKNGVSYTSKMETDLYELVRKKTYCVAAAASSDAYAFYCADGKIRIFDHVSGKIVAKLDERLSSVYDKQFEQQWGMDAMEYGRRAALELEIVQNSTVFAQHLVGGGGTTTTAAIPSAPQRLTIQFDPSGRYLIFPTLVGIKVVDWKQRTLQALIGKADASQLRFTSVCLAWGDAKVNRQMELARNAATGGANVMSAAVEEEKEEAEAIINDTLLVALAYQQQRFFVFSHVDPVTQDENNSQEIVSKRDVWNEAPSAQDQIYSETVIPKGLTKLPSKAILRTTMGDIHIQLFSQQVSKTVENFVGHSKSGYYDNVIFHRVIKGFMLQTGDPLGDGTGGESIWGGEFEDEFVAGLRHDRPFTVSMANAGPNTNGSQFFITTVPTPWLDNKHTVFGRVVQGMDVCSMIENVKTDDLDKPLNEIRIVNVDVGE